MAARVHCVAITMHNPSPVAVSRVIDECGQVCFGGRELHDKLVAITASWPISRDTLNSGCAFCQRCCFACLLLPPATAAQLLANGCWPDIASRTGLRAASASSLLCRCAQQLHQGSHTPRGGCSYQAGLLQAKSAAGRQVHSGACLCQPLAARPGGQQPGRCLYRRTSTGHGSRAAATAGGGQPGPTAIPQSPPPPAVLRPKPLPACMMREWHMACSLAAFCMGKALKKAVSQCKASSGSSQRASMRLDVWPAIDMEGQADMSAILARSADVDKLHPVHAIPVRLGCSNSLCCADIWWTSKPSKK